jgi:predicted phage terminase large subunit-like protein
VHVTIALDTESNFHILELVRGKYQMAEQVEIISQNSVRTWRGHSPDCVVIETNAYQVVLAQHLRGLLPIPISRENHNRAKVNRIMSLEPWFANAKVFVPEGAPWIEDFRNEYVRWRQIDNIQDDQLDAVQMGIKKLSQLYGATSIEQPKAGRENAELIVTLN